MVDAEPKKKRQKKGEPDEQLEPKGKPACTRGRECEDYGHPAPCKAREETPAAGLKKILSWEEKVAEEARSKTPLKWEDEVMHLWRARHMEDAWYQEERAREREREREIREIVDGAGN